MFVELKSGTIVNTDKIVAIYESFLAGSEYAVNCGADARYACTEEDRKALKDLLGVVPLIKAKKKKTTK